MGSATAVAERVLATLRPRRAYLPAFLVFAAVWFVPLHGLGGARIEGSCAESLCRPNPVVPLAVSVPGLVATYLLAVGATELLGAADWEGNRHGWLFSPSGEALRVVGVVAVAAAGFQVAVSYELLYTVAGLAGYYALYFPTLEVLPAVAWAGNALAPADGPGSGLWLFAVAASLAAVAQVLWWYLLAHGAVRAGRRLRRTGG